MKKLILSKPFLFKIIAILFIIAVFELVGWVVLKYIKPYYETARKVMLGSEKDFQVLYQNVIPQPYLLYVPAPNYVSSDGIRQHNEHGYRGNKVSLRRKPNSSRILFMGGSTTYGQCVKMPENTYPAQVGRILSKKYSDKLGDIEIINAGLLFGTTAEILTHYHFKFRYYKADVVVINTGANDTCAMVYGYYQPDYSNWRKNMVRLSPLPVYSRWLLHSKFLSIVIIKLFFSDLFSQNWFVETRYPLTPWYETKNEGRIEKFPEVADEDHAFYVNLNAIVREIKADGAKALLIMERRNPQKQDDQFKEQVDRNERLLKRVAFENQIEVVPFPADVISQENWVDHCHLNEAGEQQKAEHVANYILETLSKGHKK